MNTLKITSIAFLLNLTACATHNLNKDSQAWEALGKSEAFQKEKSTFSSRLGDQGFCWDTGLDDFLTPNSPKPNTKCIYPASKILIDKDDGIIVQNKVLRQNFNQLKVLQVSPQGFVIVSPNHRNDQVIFIHNTDEDDLIDGAFLDDVQNFKLYEYVGTYSYATLVDSKTVYSFRKVNKKLREAKNDLKYYDPLTEALIENRLWNQPGELQKKLT